MKQQLYKNGDNYIGLTGESPKEFKGYLFACWRGEPGELYEDLITLDALRDWEPVDESNVPSEWIVAFRKVGFKFKKDVREHRSSQTREITVDLTPSNSCLVFGGVVFWAGLFIYIILVIAQNIP